MNTRYCSWLIVGVGLTLLGPACMGEVTLDPRPAESTIVARESAVTALGPGSLDGTDSGHINPGGNIESLSSSTEQAGPKGGATGSYKTCSDMYFTCQEKGGFCTKKYPGCNTWGQSACGTCYENCQAGASYPKTCKCSSCGFTE